MNANMMKNVSGSNF